MKKYNNIDQQLHLLCQLIAKANRTFVPKKEDDSHTNLYFDFLGNRITGRWIETKEDKLLFALNLSNINIEVINDAQKVVDSYSTIGNTIDEIEKQIEKGLLNFGLNKSGFRDKLHYKISEYGFADQPVSSLAKDSLQEWQHYRQLANEACALLMGHAQKMEEIRIWPHHFDTGIYATINERSSIGFGLAMKDEMIGSPYFYMSGYPTKGSINYENLPDGNQWKWEIGENWKGAILTLEQLTGKTREEQKETLTNYLMGAFKWFVAQ